MSWQKCDPMRLLTWGPCAQYILRSTLQGESGINLFQNQNDTIGLSRHYMGNMDDFHFVGMADIDETAGCLLG